MISGFAPYSIAIRSDLVEAAAHHLLPRIGPKTTTAWSRTPSRKEHDDR